MPRGVRRPTVTIQATTWKQRAAARRPGMKTTAPDDLPPLVGGEGGGGGGGEGVVEGVVLRDD